MIANLLTSFREFRTPLVTAAAWTISLWLLVEPTLYRFGSGSELVRRVSSLGSLVGETASTSAALLTMYMLGTLLSVRTSPFLWLELLTPRSVKRGWAVLNGHNEPRRWRYRVVWRMWKNLGRWLRRFRPATPTSVRVDPTTWAYRKFSSFRRAGFVPNVEWEGCDPAPTGVHELYEADVSDVVASAREGVDYWSHGALAARFVAQVKHEQGSIETLIQVQHPAVYARIQALRAEADLRQSLFWPLVVAAVACSLMTTPWGLPALLLVPIALAASGARSRHEANDVVWELVTADVVTPPSVAHVLELSTQPLTSSSSVLDQLASR